MEVSPIDYYHFSPILHHKPRIWSDYDIAIRLKPDDADAYFRRGYVKAGLGQPAAILDYDIAIRLKPDDARAYFYRGLSKVLLDHTREAKQDLNTALRLATKAGNVNLKTKIEEILRILNN